MRDTMTPVRITPSLPFGGDPTDWRRRRCSRERGRVTGAIRGALLCGRPGAAVGPVAIGLVALGLAALAPSSATAQQRQANQRRPRVIQLEEIRIEGRVQKPNAFYILNRSSIGYEVLDLRTSFTREILRSVQHAPF